MKNVFSIAFRKMTVVVPNVQKKIIFQHCFVLYDTFVEPYKVATFLKIEIINSIII